jgi:RNA polymerase sigma-70 factor (ECF subfamily)
MNLEELYDEQVAKVYKFFYIQCLNQPVAEDLTSQTFMILIDKASALHIDEPKKYLYGIMRKVWLEYLREKYKTLASDIEAIDDFEQHIEEEIETFGTDVSARLRKYVDRLPESQRTVVQLRHYEDMSPKEVAIELGKDMNYVNVTYKRAMKSLRKLIESPHLLYEQEGAEII